MAQGAGGSYWDGQSLPSVFKHDLLEKYLPPFAGMTGSSSRQRRVVFLDGFAGRGRYHDGSPGSPERILQIAETQQTKAGLRWLCFFVEADAKSAQSLTSVVNEYVDRGIAAQVHHGDVLGALDAVTRAAEGCPLFLFLDPCGLGVPYDPLVEFLTKTRSHATWPPTEILLNFSLDAVRRIGGQVSSPSSNEKTLLALDQVVGGHWWRGHFQQGVSDEAVEGVVQGFCERLNQDTDLSVVTVPVRRAPHHKPIYHLTFGTHSPYGLWVFGDAVARATQKWWDSCEEVEAEAHPDTLFTIAETIRPDLEAVEKEATPVIADNLAHLLRQRPSVKVVDHPMEVFGDYYGQVRERTVRTAVKLLHQQGRTASTGVGGKPRDLVVTRPD